MGRIIARGSKPGLWLVRFDRSGEQQEVDEDRLEPTY
jgi:hypothetical protein